MPVTDRSPAHDTHHPGYRTRALRDGAHWRYGHRRFPTTTFLALGAVCCAWAILSELDAPIEATVLAILGRDPTLDHLRRPGRSGHRRIGRSLCRVDGSCPPPSHWAQRPLCWITARYLAAAVGPAPVPDSWALLEWSTIALSQVALAASNSRARPTSMSFGPGILLALVWYVVVAAPRLHQLLFDPPDHLLRWLGVLVTSAAIAGIASLDPAHRRRRQMPA